MRTQGFGALAPQPVGPSGQLEKEQTLPDAEDLFSRCGVGLGLSDSAPHTRKCSVGVELLEYVQEQDGAVGPSHTGLPPNLRPVVRPFVSSGSTPGTGLQACCGLHGCLHHRLGGHVQWACSVGGLDGSPTALAHQLPRVAGSTPGLELSQEALTRQARTGSHGQYCDRCIHQPTRWSTLPSHVAIRPPPPPLESEASEVASHHSHSRFAQPGSQRAVMSCAPGEWRLHPQTVS